jgi:hypothetical protein
MPLTDAGAASDGDLASAASAPLPVKPPGGLDKELEAKKKQAQDAETAKRKAAEEAATRARIENCARAKQAKATFESGVRIGRTNAAGQQEIMDEATRAAELKRILGIVEKDCR